MSPNTKLILCPHCLDLPMKEHVVNETHILICEECPNVMFEYCDYNNLVALIKHLETYQSMTYNLLLYKLSI
jgi:cytidine deaminase